MADTGDDGDGAGRYGARHALVVEAHELLEGAAAAHEQDGVGAHHLGRPERVDDRGWGLLALHAALDPVYDHERVAARERHLDIVEDLARERRAHDDALAELRHMQLARIVHEALGGEAPFELGDLLAQYALARELGVADDERQLAGRLVDVEVAVHDELLAILERKPERLVDALPDDRGERRLGILHLEVAVSAAGGAAEPAHLADDAERPKALEGVLGKRGGLRDGYRCRLPADVGH